MSFVLLSQLESPLSMRSNSEKVKKKFKNNFKKIYHTLFYRRIPPFFYKKIFSKATKKDSVFSFFMIRFAYDSSKNDT